MQGKLEQVERKLKCKGGKAGTEQGEQLMIQWEMREIGELKRKGK